MRLAAPLLALALASATALLPALPAAAHDLWIEPADYTPAVGQPTAVELRVGVGFPGEEVVRQAARIERFASLGSSGEAELPGVEGVSPAAVGSFEAGDHVLVYRSGDSPITLAADDFEAYLKEEGLDHVSRRRAERGETDAEARELFSRSVKALITVGDTGGTGSAHTRAAGLDLELVPETRPGDLAPGDRLTVRLLWRGEPLAGALLRSERRSAAGDGEQQAGERLRSDEQGRATFRLDGAGEWKIATVHMEAIARETATGETAAGADWRSVWTSLTFHLPAAGGEAGDDPGADSGADGESQGEP